MSARQRTALILGLAALLSGLLCSGQVKSPKAATITITPTTLLMDWSRGDAHYGPDFIFLTAVCPGKEAAECSCVADFKSTRSKEFADHVTSFPHGQVPVVYDVWRDRDGRFLGAKLERVGDWTSDRFRPNDGLLGISHVFKATYPAQKLATRVHSPSDCFPR